MVHEHKLGTTPSGVNRKMATYYRWQRQFPTCVRYGDPDSLHEIARTSKVIVLNNNVTAEDPAERVELWFQLTDQVIDPTWRVEGYIVSPTEKERTGNDHGRGFEKYLTRLGENHTVVTLSNAKLVYMVSCSGDFRLFGSEIDREYDIHLVLEGVDTIGV